MAAIATPDRVAFGDFVLERSQQRVFGPDGTPLTLTPRLFSALLLFTEHAGELLEKDWLMQTLWPGLVVEENNLSQVISGLRRVLGDDAQGSRYIQTVPRLGFRFVAAVRPLVPPSASDAASPTASHVAADASHPTDRAWSRRRWLWGLGPTAVGAALGTVVWRSRSGPPPAAIAARPATLAVLPFGPIAAEGRDEMLEFGMADSLIAHLSNVPGVVVRSIGSVRRYTGAQRDPSQAGRDLDVAWIVDGSLQRHGDRLRVTARLLRTADGTAAWSGSFDERYTGVFELQDRIADRVAETLAPMLQVGSTAQAAHPPLADAGGTRSTEAYQLYLAATRLAQSGRADRIDKAVALFNQALGIDPAYAQAWVGLAWAHRRKLWNVDTLPAEVFDPANVALQRALVVAPHLPEAHAGLGFSLYWFDFDWAAAERRFGTVVAVNPSNALAHYGLGLLMLTQDRLEDGFAHLRAARELDPMSPVFNTVEGSFLLDRGLLAEARVRLNRAFDIAPDLWLVHVAQGLLHRAEDRADQCIASLRRAVALADGSTRPQAVLAVHLAANGRAAEARSILDGLQATAKVRYVPPTTLATVHAALGETPMALDALERALLARDTRLIYLKDDPHWIGLRAEPRYVALLRRLKLDGFGRGLSPV